MLFKKYTFKEIFKLCSKFIFPLLEYGGCSFFTAFSKTTDHSHSSGYVGFFVDEFTLFYMYVWYMFMCFCRSMCLCGHAEVRTACPTLSILWLECLRQDLFLTWSHTGNQQALGTLPSPQSPTAPQPWGYRYIPHIFLCGSWGFKLRHSCFHSKSSYSLKPSLSPWYIGLNLWFNFHL